MDIYIYVAQLMLLLIPAIYSASIYPVINHPAIDCSSSRRRAAGKVWHVHTEGTLNPLGQCL